VAQSNTFILAGYETTANTLSFCIYSIANEPEVQRRLLQEVDAFGRDRRVTYADLDKVGWKQAWLVVLHGQHVLPKPVLAWCSVFQ
jgi:cytochrome P450